MPKFSVHKSDNNKKFYAKFSSSSDMVFQTPIQYDKKRTAFEAIAANARYFNMFIVEVSDQTGDKPVTREIYLDAHKIIKIKTVENAKGKQRSRKD